MYMQYRFNIFNRSAVSVAEITQMNFGVMFLSVGYIASSVLVPCMIKNVHAVCEFQHLRCTKQLRTVISVLLSTLHKLYNKIHMLSRNA